MDYNIVREKGKILWTEEQINYIIDKYLNEGYSLAKLGNEFSCAYGTIRALLEKNNVQSQGIKHNYPRNSEYFSSIETPEKAYWLGFLYADGCVHSNNNEVSINITDEEHVIKFKNAIGAFNHKICITKDKRFKNAKTLYQFSIKDKQLHDDLIKFGCVPQKSLLIKGFPDINKNLISHFIRGYFDGDGSLHYLKCTNNWRISFLGTEAFLKDIKEYFNFNAQISQTTASGKAYSIQIMGKHQLKRILDCLYNNSEELTRLNRKYDKYQQFLKEY